MERRLKKFKFIFVYGFTVLLLFSLLYFGLLPISIYSNRFRFWLVVIPALVAVPFIFQYRLVYKSRLRKNIDVSFYKKGFLQVKYVYYALGVAVLVFIILGVSTWPIFNTTRYRELIQVTESEGFTQNIKDFSETKVPIIDKDLAMRLGDKKLGELNLGSQFTVNNYTMIKMEDELYWVGALEYTGFFKWINKKDEGTPGYIKINATDTSDVELVSDYKLKYVPSAYFGQDLMRRIYFSGNMDKVFSDYTAFELDETGHPYYIKTVLSKKFAYTKGRDAIGVVVCDAVNGDVHYYDIKDVPSWIDRIQPTDVIIEQLGYYGKYVHGFFNTLFAKKEVLQVSEGYSYVYNDGVFYLYTGLTSVGSDESIVGFTLTNMRTKETTFYRIGGATEYSAQNSAQGAVQDLGYKANWPILVNFEQTPTYFMTLKDKEGLIKKYAYVNVKDYSVYGIGDSLQSAQSNYRENLRTSTTNPNKGIDLKEVTSTVVRIVPVNGTSNYYFVLENDSTNGYTVAYNVSFEVPLTSVGDRVNIKYYDNQSQSHVYTVEEFDNLELTITE
ncbi:hypothetical protein KHQ81_02960 [Mycoplasmatota bacterium]|nr:hypothetical protein KHQ81_02960 [Mycoplasmatota bacterium]